MKKKIESIIKNCFDNIIFFYTFLVSLVILMIFFWINLFSFLKFLIGLRLPSIFIFLFVCFIFIFLFIIIYIIFFVFISLIYHFIELIFKTIVVNICTLLDLENKKLKIKNLATTILLQEIKNIENILLWDLYLSYLKMFRKAIFEDLFLILKKFITISKESQNILKIYESGLHSEEYILNKLKKIANEIIELTECIKSKKSINKKNV